jgi:MoxR-like ATPase
MKTSDGASLPEEKDVCNNSKLALCDSRDLYKRLTSLVVGRRRELKLILSAIYSGKAILLIGPPGTSKSTLLRALCRTLGLCLFFCEGNADLTASKLVGYFDPAAVLHSGYIPENFTKGVLTRAMENGGILYIEDINRIPPDALNALVTVLSEGEISIPRYGKINAHKDFRVVASLSMFGSIGPTKLSRAILDRFVQINLDYQSEEEEKEIVTQITQCDIPWLINLGVKIARGTRKHPDLRLGASVRGAIDFVRLIVDLTHLDSLYEDYLLEIANLSFSSKIWKKASCERTEEEIVEELLRDAILSVSVENGLKTTDDYEKKELSPDKWPGLDEAKFKRMSRWLKLLRQNVNSHRRNLYLLSTLGDYLSQIKSVDVLKDILRGPSSPELYLLMRQTLNEQTKTVARELATQVIMNRAHNLTFFGLRTGERKRFRFDGDGLIDIDRTVENIVEKGERHNLSMDDIIVTKRERTKRTCLLMIDASESMFPMKIGLAALAAAVLSYCYSSKDDFYGVMAFHSLPFILKPIEKDIPVDKIVEDILTLDATRGSFTNYYRAFNVAFSELSQMSSSRKEIFLMTDGAWTVGDDPRPLIHKSDVNRINVLYLERGDFQFAKELAYKGQVVKIDGWPSIVKGINQIMNTPY